MYIGIKFFGANAGGLFSAEYLDASWSVGRIWDMLKHMWLPVVIVGTSGTAGTIRVMRATTLDELGRPYVETARAKGLREGPLTMKYPVRVALNPILSTIGWKLPEIVSGTVLVALVLNLAHDRATPVAGADVPRPVSCRQLYHDPEHVNPDRHADLRYSAGVGRSAHSLRRTGNDMTSAVNPSAEHSTSPYESGNLSDLLDAEGTVGETRVQYLTPRQLMFIRFRKNRLAVLGFWLLLLIYLSVLFAPMIAPYDRFHRFNKQLYLPPRDIQIRGDDGSWRRPFVYAVTVETNKETFTRDFVEDRSQEYPIQFFVKGDPYKLWGLFEMDWHLFGVENVEEVGPVFLLGGDKFGRDIFGRVLFGGRISLTLGLVGVSISLFIGLLLGGLSGLYGGVVDNVIQRLIEFIRSIPTIPLWMGLAAALPADWPQFRIYLGITIILSLIGWTTLARVVRGKFLSLRDEDFVLAAQSAGANQWYLIWQHLVPLIHELRAGGPHARYP